MFFCAILYSARRYAQYNDATGVESVSQTETQTDAVSLYICRFVNVWSTEHGSFLSIYMHVFYMYT